MDMQRGSSQPETLYVHRPKGGSIPGMFECVCMHACMHACVCVCMHLCVGCVCVCRSKISVTFGFGLRGEN